MRIGLLGLGLVGGSIARSLREREPGAWTVAAWTPTGRGPTEALRQGVIDRVATSVDEAVDGVELIVLAAPPLECLDLLAAIHPAPGATVTDVASTKGAIVARADDLGLRFVGGHPMAGRETAGFEASSADLFVDRPWVVIAGATATTGDVGRAKRLVRATGARPIAMSAQAHDQAVAAISHLPLVLAAALVEAVAGNDGWPTARPLAANGWRDMTRLARGDVAMGAGIAATNADALADRIRDVRDVLDAWLRDLGATGGTEPDVSRIAARLEAARAALEDPG
jgi:prephenate dehydrogenase